MVDFAYNLLASARPDAIVFTNGDNDTYPPLALQAKYGIRTDVRIVNLSLLNRAEYAMRVWDGWDRPRPFTDEEIRSLYDDWSKDPEGLSFAMTFVRTLLERSIDGTWSTPLYFATTVAPPHLETCPNALRLEGLLFRVTPDPKPEGDGEPGVDMERTLSLYRTAFRMDSATDLSAAWGPKSAARRLPQNYAAVLRSVASEAARQGNLDEVRYALGEAIRLLDFLGESEMSASLVEYWNKIDPDAPRPDPPVKSFR
ncbi:MAG: hypothetical protein R3E97_20255 [Candidatus Eisenbacteria bacterium]